MNSIILYPHTFTKSNKLLTELLILFFYSRNHLNFSFYSNNFFFKLCLQITKVLFFLKIDLIIPILIPYRYQTKIYTDTYTDIDTADTRPGREYTIISGVNRDGTSKQSSRNISISAV